MNATCLAHFTILNLIIIIFGMGTTNEAPHYLNFPAPCDFLPPQLKYTPQHPVLKQPQSMLFP